MDTYVYYHGNSFVAIQIDSLEKELAEHRQIKPSGKGTSGRTAVSGLGGIGDVNAQLLPPLL